MRILRHLSLNLFVVFAILCAAHSVSAQTESGTITGLITDQSAAVVPDADVELTSIERGTVEQTRSNGSGIYTFASVTPGRYNLSVSHAGFRQVDMTRLVVNVQSQIELNIKLEVGSVSESVTVDASAQQINTSDGSVSTVVDSTMVANMPLNGRSFQDLILLTPGIVTQSPQTGAQLGQQGEFSVNGQRTESNNYTVDGVSANVGASPGYTMTATGASGSLAAATALGTTQALVSVDDLQEFRVESSTYSAEYGRNPGGQFAFDTKSGTNQGHGTAYDYLRNGYFDAQDWFNDYFGTPEPDLRQNDFGGTFGAPVEIPGLYYGKDRTFFFVSYEGLRLTAPQAATPNYVPDNCLRGVIADCSGTNAPAAAALLSVLNAFPQPSPDGVDDAANGIAQFIGSWSNPSSLNSTSVRFDHIVNEKLRIFFRFSDTNSDTAMQGAGGRTPTTYGTSPYSIRTYTAGMSSTITNRLSNEFRLNYSSNEAAARWSIDALGGGTPVDLAQLTGVSAGSEVDVFLFISGYDIAISQLQESSIQRQWNLVDTVSRSIGRHQFRFGVDYRRLAPDAISPNPDVPYYYGFIDGVEDLRTNTAFTSPTVISPAYPLYTNFSAFAQDEWKVSRRLNLSMGLRWELNPAPGVTQGLKPYTISFQGSGPDTWVLAPQGAPLWQTTWFNFAPRLGAAYILRTAPSWETVVRGGGGVFFDTGQQLGSYGSLGPGFDVSGGFYTTPFPGTPVTIPTIVNPPVPPYPYVYGFATHLQLPYTIQWNASIEQALGKSQTATLSYVGSHGSRLLQNNVYSTPTNPNASSFYVVANGLTSDYDALQVQFRRGLSRGLTALGSYTWSHCLDYGSSNLLYGYQRGDCDFDIRNNVSTALSYDLPNVGDNRFTNAIVQHWGIDDRFTARTAFPVTLDGYITVDPATLQQFYGGLNLVSGQAVYLYGANCTSTLLGLGDLTSTETCPGGRAINPNAFTVATSGLGDAPRNFVRGFGAWQMDSALRREFPVHENLKLQFRAEAFNLFNHPSFGIINSSFGQPTFGQATATLANSLGVLNPLYQQGGPRSMQFAIKIIF
jgi:hypothetical protein